MKFHHKLPFDESVFNINTIHDKNRWCFILCSSSFPVFCYTNTQSVCQVILSDILIIINGLWLLSSVYYSSNIVNHNLWYVLKGIFQMLKWAMTRFVPHRQLVQWFSKNVPLFYITLIEWMLLKIPWYHLAFGIHHVIERFYGRFIVYLSVVEKVTRFFMEIITEEISWITIITWLTHNISNIENVSIAFWLIDWLDKFQIFFLRTKTRKWCIRCWNINGIWLWMYGSCYSLKSEYL